MKKMILSALIVACSVFGFSAISVASLPTNVSAQAANSVVKKGIKTANVSDYSTNSVAQLAITYLLNALTPITEYSKEVKNNKWLDITIPEYQSYPVNDAEGKILGVVGFGNIGKKVAAIAEVLGMEVMVAKIPGRNYDKNKSKNIHEKRYDLDEVLEKCDVLTLHTPLSELTRDLINLERMKKMKK